MRWERPTSRLDLAVRLATLVVFAIAVWLSVRFDDARFFTLIAAGWFLLVGAVNFAARRRG